VYFNASHLRLSLIFTDKARSLPIKWSPSLA
jgi:hypothetical protein